MMAPHWLSAIQPIRDSRPEPLIPGSDLLVWNAILEFKHWRTSQEETNPPWKETYGKTLIASDAGTWTAAEIELVRRFREAGWQAGWVDTYGQAPKKWTEWLVKPSSLPGPLRDWYIDITRNVDRNGGGKPDIVAWQGNSLGDAVFIEYKGPNDRIRPGQDAWVRMALQKGMSLDQFAVARWPKQARHRKKKDQPNGQNAHLDQDKTKGPKG